MCRIVARRVCTLLGCALIASSAIGYLGMRLYMHALTFYDYLLAPVIAIAAVTVVALYRRYFPNTKRVARLGEMIHYAVCHHVMLGHAKLYPPGISTPTIYLRISVALGEIAVIDQFDWDAYHDARKSNRIFRITPEGEVVCRSSDHAWVHAPLVRQLERLLEALREYEPRVEVKRARR